MKLLTNFKHRIGYAVRIALLCAAASISVPTQAQAAINYLVAAPTLIAANTYSLNLSISTTCPAGYLIHRYGLDDVNVFNLNGGARGTSGGPTTPAGFSTCFAGVPSSLNISGVANSLAGSAYAVSANVTLTSANSPQSVNPWGGGAFIGGGGGCVHLAMPDNFHLIIMQSATAAWTGYIAVMSGRVLVEDMAYGRFFIPGKSFTGYWGVITTGNGTVPSLVYDGLAGTNQCNGYVIGY